MHSILTAIGAFFAMRRVSEMMTNPLDSVPSDWRFLRISILGTLGAVAISYGVFKVCFYLSEAVKIIFG